MKRSSKTGRVLLVVILASVTAFVAPKLSFSQDKYPEKPITIIHGWGAGGTGDIFARLMGSIASKDLGQSVIIENRPGAAGMIAVRTIVKSKPDGYTLGVSVSSQFLTLPHIQKIDFDPINDPTHILTFMHNDLGVVVRSDSPWKTWEEFKHYAKENPGKVRYATSGAGSMQNLTLEMVAQKEGIKWIHIPYKTGNEPGIAALGGHVEAAAETRGTLVPHIKEGKLRLILALSQGRWEIAPNAPDIGELGYPTAFAYQSIFGPKGLPESIRLKLRDVFRKAIQDPAFVAAGNNLQMNITYIDGKEYTELLRDRAERYKKIIYDLGLNLKEN